MQHAQTGTGRVCCHHFPEGAATPMGSGGVGDSVQTRVAARAKTCVPAIATPRTPPRPTNRKRPLRRIATKPEGCANERSGRGQIHISRRVDRLADGGFWIQLKSGHPGQKIGALCPRKYYIHLRRARRLLRSDPSLRSQVGAVTCHP